MVCYIEQLLQEGLELPMSFELQVERAHQAVMPRLPLTASPRSIVAKLSSYRMKNELLRLARQKQGFLYLEKKVNLDHDYAPEMGRIC